MEKLNGHKLFEISDIKNIILNYLTKGEICYIQNKKCSEKDVLHSIENFLTLGLVEMIKEFRNHFEISDKKINNILLRGTNKEIIKWFYDNDLLVNKIFFELLFSDHVIMKQ